MYRRSDNLNGCLSVSAYRLGDKMNISASKTNDDIKIFIKPIGKKVVVVCSLVCTINRTSYLKVNPDYVWLTPDILSSGEFNIYSNVAWKID